jgi:hypothetical protein
MSSSSDTRASTVRRQSAALVEWSCWCWMMRSIQSKTSRPLRLAEHSSITVLPVPATAAASPPGGAGTSPAPVGKVTSHLKEDATSCRETPSI